MKEAIIEQMNLQFDEMKKIATHAQSIADDATNQRNEALKMLRHCRYTLQTVRFEMGSNNSHFSILNQIDACINKINETLGEKK